MIELENEIKKLSGPILILGAGGFVGANLFHMLHALRQDVFAVMGRFPVWRLENVSGYHIIQCDLTLEHHLKNVLDKIHPATVFDCVAYGAYSFQKDIEKIYKTNLFLKTNLILELIKRKIPCYIHAGTSSEYGVFSDRPKEEVMLTPNSHYAVTKAAVSNLIYFAGKEEGLCCANLRLYSAYGPLEDAARLIPNIIKQGLEGRLPPFVKPETSRDFIYIDDVCSAFVKAATHLKKENWGESFNIGSGVKTTIRDLALTAKDLYHVQENPVFESMASRIWDTQDWVSNPTKAHHLLDWKAKYSLKEGLLKTTEWFKTLKNKQSYFEFSEQSNLNRKLKNSISAIVACYKDALAMPIMVERLVAVFEKCKIEYEIILVNDGSPDNSEEVIKNLSSQNAHIMGITHARNFGSQQAFRSGMEIANFEACVLLDGDLQDPPELIEQFIEKWRVGFDVVYGVRTKREASWFMQWAYKFFYRVFSWASSIPIPRDAGDFSLMDKRVVAWILACRERDLFLRGLRAYVGFKQIGAPYIRPERMFGKTTNSLFKNFDWAKKGIFSFSKKPLNILTGVGISLVCFTVLLAIYQIISRLLFPGSAPHGVTTLMLLIMFFGSFTILSISIIGEYISKIFEEVKARPNFIRKHFIKEGQIQPLELNELK
ncbi:MAG: epimerase [Gammaproteobacteria bacterium RIFCSPLOWO2_02_FULL_38_11]|nr:MAG: epimerase [Gammaproteobacteria bacterium RIFCSPLOWO2_02_FULL_38_11]OGT76314.1 MAG: epimerase [Gammaproteobacteria bacterium RIFCSPLOWO2_12_FULL_38_14]